MTTDERIEALTKELLLSRCDHYASPEFYACGNCIREFLAEKLAEEREACAKRLEDLYERGPGRGNAGWSQAWGSGVLDAAELLRAPVSV